MDGIYDGSALLLSLQPLRIALLHYQEFPGQEVGTT